MKIREIREVPRYLRKRPRMPVARFELYSSREPELLSVALDDVVLLTPEDTLEAVKERAAQLSAYRERRLLYTRYDLRYADSSLAALYRDSSLFRRLRRLAQTGGKREGFLFDRARVRMGLIVLTGEGREYFETPEPGCIPF